MLICFTYSRLWALEIPWRKWQRMPKLPDWRKTKVVQWIQNEFLPKFYIWLFHFSLTQKKTPHLDRGLFEIFRYLLVAKTLKNDTNHCGRLSWFFIHFAISTPPGCPWGSTERGEPIEFDFLGLECDHQVLKLLEPKNFSKRAKFC